MKSLETWLSDYSNDHRNPENQLIHMYCVPAIFFTVVGLLHLIPIRVYIFSLGDVLIMGALVWYLFLSFLAFGIAGVQVLAFVGITNFIRDNVGTTNAVILLVITFVLAWIGQFYGHKLEGRKPSFLRDLQYLLIGPLWVWLGKHK